MIGKTLKIDRTTAFSEKGGFARMYVEVDLQKPLLLGFSHFGEESRFKYEGLHLVCFTCGRYGHRMDQYTVTTQSKEPGNSSSEAPSVATTVPENPPVKGVNEMGNSDGNDKCVNYGPQMLVKREFGNNAGKVEGKGSNQALAKNKAGKGVEGVNAPNNVRDLADQKGVLNGKKAGDVEAGLCNFGIVIQNRNEKQEWIQVGAKRKAGAKIKARGKENKMERIKPQSRGMGKEICMKSEINESKSKALMVPNGGVTELEIKKCSGPSVLKLNNQDSNVGEIIVEKKCGPIFNANKDGKDSSNDGGSGVHVWREIIGVILMRLWLRGTLLVEVYRGSDREFCSFVNDADLHDLGFLEGCAMMTRVDAPFRFLAAWVLDERFSSFVSGTECRLGLGERILINLPWPRKQWNMQVFGHTNNRKRQLLARLNGITRTESRFGLSMELEELRGHFGNNRRKSG
ncbi:hypothetical protein K1719_021844 [Acacia pycnantha]|nr:hypothetical protein K1719_021844 [Acacia pycnantha]